MTVLREGSMSKHHDLTACLGKRVHVKGGGPKTHVDPMIRTLVDANDCLQGRVYNKNIELPLSPWIMARFDFNDCPNKRRANVDTTCFSLCLEHIR